MDRVELTSRLERLLVLDDEHLNTDEFEDEIVAALVLAKSDKQKAFKQILEFVLGSDANVTLLQFVVYFLDWAELNQTILERVESSKSDPRAYPYWKGVSEACDRSWEGQSWCRAFQNRAELPPSSN